MGTPEPASRDAALDDFGSLFSLLPIGAYRSLPCGRMLRANPALVRLNGYDSEAELLHAVRDIAGQWYVQAGRRDEFMALMEAHGRVSGFESEVRRGKTGERIWVSETGHAIRDAGGAVIFYEGTIEEVTDRVREREALARSESQLQQLMALVPGAVYRVTFGADGRRRYTYISAGVRGLYGVEPEEVLRDGDALIRMRHPDDAARMVALGRAAIADGLPLLAETRVRLRDGSEKWVQVLSAPAPPEDGDPVRVGMLFDITARKRAEQALRENSELWKLALECTGDGVWDWHLQEGREILSPQCKALYGYGPDELPETPEALDRLTHPDDLPAMRQAREAHFDGRLPIYANEHRVRCKDGQWKWILSRGMVMARDAQGRPLRMVGTHTDITARKQAEALRIERDLAAAADLAKSQFLSRVSHELRTPLNAVLGFAQLLQLDLGDGERQRRWLAQVLSSGRHLQALMDDVLDLSSAQTGHLRMATEVLPAQPLLAEVITMLSGAAAAAGVTVHDDTAGRDVPPLRADRKRVLQVLSNLVSNAIKYNRPGGWVRLQASAADGMLVLAVADSGPGLSAAQRARLFEPFERLEAQRGPVAGTGLGLAVARQFAQAMGGRIDVASEPGQGAVFSLHLPLG